MTTTALAALRAMHDHGNPYHDDPKPYARKLAVGWLVNNGMLCPRTNRITMKGLRAMRNGPSPGVDLPH